MNYIILLLFKNNLPKIGYIALYYNEIFKSNVFKTIQLQYQKLLNENKYTSYYLNNFSYLMI